MTEQPECTAEREPKAQFIVTGVEKASGNDVTLTIEAASCENAKIKAGLQDIEVSSCVAIATLETERSNKGCIGLVWRLFLKANILAAILFVVGFFVPINPMSAKSAWGCDLRLT